MEVNACTRAGEVWLPKLIGASDASHALICISIPVTSLLFLPRTINTLIVQTDEQATESPQDYDWNLYERHQLLESLPLRKQTTHPTRLPPTMGSVVIPHLVTGWHVDQAIMSEEDRLVVIRFGRDWDPDCMRQDEVLYKIADRVKNFAVIYVCDIDQVPDFKQMYELYDTVTLMFFFRNKHMMCDFGTGNNNKLNWVLEDKQELIDILETIYKGAKKGRGLVVSPKDYSTRYRY